jgi:flagellar hook-basal body complex protein FliE
MAISGINPISSISPSVFGTTKIGEDQGQGQNSFVNILNGALSKLNDVNNMQNESKKISNDFVSGRIDDIDSVMITSQKADIALQFTMQVRNKILDAYNEIMRIQI